MALIPPSGDQIKSIVMQGRTVRIETDEGFYIVAIDLVRATVTTDRQLGHLPALNLAFTADTVTYGLLSRELEHAVVFQPKSQD